MYALFVLWPLVADRSSTRSTAGTASARAMGRARRTTRRSSPTPICSACSITRCELIMFFSFIPVLSGSSSQRHPPDRGRRGSAPSPGRCCSCRRSSRSSPRASSGAGCCRRPASSTRCLSAVGLGGVTRAWLGDFDTALPAVGADRRLGAARAVHRAAAHRHDARSTRRCTKRPGSTAPGWSGSSVASRCRACATRSASA